MRYLLAILFYLSTALLALAQPDVQVTSATNAQEGTPASNGSFGFTLDAPAPAGGLVVSFNASGTALPVTNYTLIAGTNVTNLDLSTNKFTIAAGAMTAQLVVVPVNNFTLNAPPLNITLTVVADPAYVVGTIDAATITLIDDTNLFTVTTTGTPAEDGVFPANTGKFLFTRSNTASTVAVNFTVGGTASLGTKYTASSTVPMVFNATSGTIVLLSGEASAEITITAINDQIINAPRTVVINLVDASPKSYTIGSPSTATMSIADAVAPTVSITSSGTPAEGGLTPNATITFTRTGSTTLPLSVNFDITGTAVVGTNYNLANGATLVSGNIWTVTIPAGQTVKVINFNPINDYVANAPRTAMFTLVNTTPNVTYNIALAPNHEIILNIADDPDKITVVSSSAVVAGSTGTFTFSRVNTTGLRVIAFTTAFTGGLTFGTHFTVSSTSGYSFNAGGTSYITIGAGQTSAVFNINVLPSAPAGTITVTVVAPAPYAPYTIGTPNTDVLTVSLATSSVIVGATSPITEGGTGSTVTFTRIGLTPLPVTINFAVTPVGSVTYAVTGAGSTNFSAGLGVNTSVAGFGRVVIPGGGLSATATATISAMEDFTVNGTRSIGVTITGNSLGIPLGTPSSDNIQVNDSNRQLTVTSSASNASEDGTTANFLFTRTGGNTVAQVINFTMSGTANAANYTLNSTQPLTYTYPTGTITIPIGSNSATLTLNPTNDFSINTARTAILTMSVPAPPNPNAIAIANNTATITIDDDPNVVTIEAVAGFNASETGSIGKFRIKRNTATVSPLTVRFDASTGTAVYTATPPVGATANTFYTQTGANTTYSGSNNESVTIPAGSTFVEVTIQPYNNFTINPNRTVVFQLLTGTGYRLHNIATQTQASISIADDNNTVTIAALATNPTKSGTTSKFIFTLSSAISTDLLVRFSVGGTAPAAGANQAYNVSGETSYATTTVSNGSITIPANSTTAELTVTPINDFVINPPNKTIILTLQNGAYLIGAANTANLTIIDDNNHLSLAPATGTTQEIDFATGLPEDFNFTFSRTNGVNTNPLTVKFSATNTSAIFNTDYLILGATMENATKGTATIPAGQNSVTITLRPIDNFVTGNKTVTFTIADSTVKSYATNQTAKTSAITITDANNPVTITSTGTAIEDGSGAGATFTIARQTATPLPLTVSFNVGGTAILGTNYSTTPAFTSPVGTATIPANQTNVVFTVNPIDDFVVNADRTITLQLVPTTPSPTYNIGTANSATVIIQNDDIRASVVANGTPTETNQVAAKLVLNFNVPFATNTTINYQISGTANASRYVITGGTNVVGTPTATSCVVLAGQTTAELIVTPIDDVVFNAAQTIVLTLQPSTQPIPDYFLTTNTVATLTIADNEANLTCGTTTTLNIADNTTATIGYNANTAGQAIQIDMNSLDLQSNDKVLIYNGLNTSANNLIAEFTGIVSTDTFSTIDQFMTVVVKTAGTGVSIGGNITLRCVPASYKINCGASNPTVFCFPLSCTGLYPNNLVATPFKRTYKASSLTSQIEVSFSRFDVEANYDTLIVYDANDAINDSIIGKYHNGNLPPASITSTNSDGALTFVFKSDANVAKTGFSAEISCTSSTILNNNIVVSQADSLALLAFMRATNNTMNWDTSDRLFDWQGVTMNREAVRRVTSLKLPSAGIEGFIPDDFAKDPAGIDDRLAFMQTLDLSNNRLEDAIPATIGSLKVQHLDLSNNLLDGTIPTGIGNINNLITLNLSSNLIDGNINITALRRLQNLTDLDLSNNYLDGSIPAGFGAMPKLSQLNLSTNELTGQIPDSLQMINDLKSIDLSGNQLTGSMNLGVPANSFLLPNLENINISDNQLTGSLPQSLPQSLRVLNLANNKLTGRLDDLHLSTGLTIVNLSQNAFSGNLPTNFDNLIGLITLNLSNNKFTGTIPALSRLASLRSLNLSFNQFTGALPASFTNLSSLTSFVVNDNKLKDLPNLTSLTNLNSFNVYNNLLTFEDLEPNVGITNFNAAAYSPQANINDTLRLNINLGSRLTLRTNTPGTANFYQWQNGNAGNLTTTPIANDSLYVFNSLSAADAGVYTCAVTSTKVRDLTLQRNSIFLNVGNPQINVTDSLALVALYRSANGGNWENKWDLLKPVRTWYGITLDMDRVVIVRLNDNKLEGTINDSVRLLTRMEEFNLRKNRLTGKMPQNIGALIKLKRLDLSGNKLDNGIPANIGQLADLTYLDISENLLSGNVPSSLAQLGKLETLLLNDNQLANLPTLTGLTLLKRLGVENNLFLFGDLEPNAGFISNATVRFTYAPQAPINEQRTIQAVFATALTMTVQTTGTNNSYQWTKSGVNIGTQSTSTEFRIASLAYTDSGTYSCKVTNARLPNLTLLRRNLTLVVNQPNLSNIDSLALVDLYNSTNGAAWDKVWDLTKPMDTWFGVVLDKSIGRVVSLLISNNKLKGTLPASIGNLTKLKELSIRTNPDLIGSIPATLGNLVELQDLNLRGNQLNGGIPASLGNLAALKTLSLDNNKFSGAIPAVLGKLTKLNVLALNNNDFAGAAPKELNELVLLQELYLNENLLTSLPDLSKLTVLGTIDVRNNFLGFESLEPLVRVASFQANPQKPIPISDITIGISQTLTLNTRAGGTQNVYVWKQGNPPMLNTINNATTAIYEKTNAQTNATGTYVCEVSNAIVKNLVISYLYNVRVVPNAPDITRPLPYCIGNSTITLTAQGTQARDTKWTWYNATTRKDSVINSSRNFTFQPKQDIDTVYAVTVSNGVVGSATATIILHIRPIIAESNGVLTVIDNGNATNRYQWLFNNEVIANAISKTYTPTTLQKGTFKVTITTSEGCSASSVDYRFGLVTGIADEMLNKALQVFPNPATQTLHLNLENEEFGLVEYEILDALGRTIWKQETEKTEFGLQAQIDINSWAAGTYLLKLKTAKAFAVRKIVKE
jgi:Leucine-rich repeat (LRR) protein